MNAPLTPADITRMALDILNAKLSHLKPDMAREPQQITAQFAAYEFLRLLGGWQAGLLAGNARKGETAAVSRMQDFHFPTPNGWSAGPKKIAIIDNVVMEHELTEQVKVSAQMLAGSGDDFSDACVRPAADKIGRQIAAICTGSKTLVMGVPEYEPGPYATYSVADKGSGRACSVMKASLLAENGALFEFRVIFGFAGNAIRVAEIFSEPNRDEIAALEAEKVRLQGVLAKLNAPPLRKSEDAWVDMLRETIELSPKAPWVGGVDPGTPGGPKIGDTIFVRKPQRFTP